MKVDYYTRKRLFSAFPSLVVLPIHLTKFFFLDMMNHSTDEFELSSRRMSATAQSVQAQSSIGEGNQLMGHKPYHDDETMGNDADDGFEDEAVEHDHAKAGKR